MEEEKEKRAVPEIKGRRRSPRRLLRGLLFLAVCAAVVAVLVYSPLFTLQRVIVNGNQYLSREEIMEIARIHIGRPLFQLQTDAVTRNLTRDLRIESASVRRRMPDTVEIDMTERVPVATAACDYGYVDLDRQGKVIAGYRTLKRMPIPLITGVVLHDLYIGDDNTDETVGAVLVFLQKINPEALNRISEIHIGNPEEIVAYTTDSVQIRLGNMDRLDEKAKLTQDFLEDLEHAKYPVEYVDFRYTAPFIRLKNMPEAVMRR